MLSLSTLQSLFLQWPTTWTGVTSPCLEWQLCWLLVAALWNNKDTEMGCTRLFLSVVIHKIMFFCLLPIFRETVETEYLSSDLNWPWKEGKMDDLQKNFYLLSLYPSQEVLLPQETLLSVRTGEVVLSICSLSVSPVCHSVTNKNWWSKRLLWFE